LSRNRPVPQDHEMEYLGAYTTKNVKSLHNQARNGRIRHYYPAHEERRKLSSKEVPGIRFFYIERAKRGWGRQYFIVGAELDGRPVLARTPVPLNPEEHTDKKGLFAAPRLGRESAKHVLRDLKKVNPDKQSELEAIWNAYESTKKVRRPQR